MARLRARYFGERDTRYAELGPTNYTETFNVFGPKISGKYAAAGGGGGMPLFTINTRTKIDALIRHTCPYSTILTNLNHFSNEVV